MASYGADTMLGACLSWLTLDSVHSALFNCLVSHVMIQRVTAAFSPPWFAGVGSPNLHSFPVDHAG